MSCTHSSIDPICLSNAFKLIIQSYIHSRMNSFNTNGGDQPDNLSKTCEKMESIVNLGLCQWYIPNVFGRVVQSELLQQPIWKDGHVICKERITYNLVCI